ncbi:hypothetical protein QBZ16_003662 [Prototheca wickerhamii]|uniref:Alpha-1,3-glucosyltransferase n=1 Tax=Prototheca wickerhamii TaxID=3111 RepID=A0AAD9IMP1_PROWI|nr:hypothetical protein QBZ16_003662 [Prototheca wickerhamii]
MAAVEPASVALGTSRGRETELSKLTMRWTVLASDVLVFFPAALALARLAPVTSGRPSKELTVLVNLLLSPALILIDHGHFQYNCINLGLAVAATALALRGRLLIAAFFFVAALSHKQMLLFYSPAFFAYMLGLALRRPTWPGKISLFGKLAGTVIASFAALWAPFIGSSTHLLAVLGRIFPSSRGLFEDYVANFWCVSSLAIKWRRLLSQRQLLALCALCTLAAFLPALCCTLARPSRRALLLALANASLAFFLFSYQVHEKSVLVPLVALGTLGDRDLSRLAQFAAVFSMLPLLRKDGLALAALASCLAYAGALELVGNGGQGRNAPFRVLPQSARFPFLEDAAIVSWSAAAFFLLFLATNRLQWLEYRHAALHPKHL